MELDQLLSRLVSEVDSLNDRVKGLERGEVKPSAGARVTRSAAQTIATGVATDIAFDEQRFDSGGFHSTSVNNERYTTLVSGIYVLSGGVRWASNTTGYRQITMRLNGTTPIGADRKDALQTGPTIQCLTTVYYLDVGDYVTLEGFQNSGGNLDIDKANALTPEFAIAGPF